jgi:MYXO-CTERM domain-containing protein
MTRRLGLGPVVCILVGCSQQRDESAVLRAQSGIELSQEGKVFALATTLGKERSASARQRESAARATGALFAPQLDGSRNPVVSSNGIRIRGSCGVTFVAPSFAITAAHCVGSTDSDLDHLVLEMYRPTPTIEAGFLRATALSGSFPDFQHPRLDANDGYFFDRYPCQLFARCSEKFGGPVGCEASASAGQDTALIFCQGTPGLKYGFIEVAAEEAAEAEVFMPWKHEIYDVPADTDDERWQHYVLFPPSLPADDAGTGTPDYTQNYHYFGQDQSDIEQNQLLPLVSVDFLPGTAQATPHSKLTATDTTVSTDLLGCHGTSGSGVLQPGRGGAFELLGPAVLGNPENDDYLCDHIPALDGFTRDPGCLGLSYGLLGTTRYLVQHSQLELAADCGAWLSGATTIYTHSACLRDALGELAQHLVAPTATSPWDYLDESVVALMAGETVNLSVFQAVAGQRYRVGLVAWSEAGCPSPPCPRISVSLAGLEVLSHTFEFAAGAPVPLAAAVLADTTGSVTLALHAENGTRFELGGLVWAPDVTHNTFDAAPDRMDAVLFDLDTSSPGPAPARFAGDGKEGFAAWLLPNERLLFPRQAITPGHRWSARFSVTTAEASSDPVELICGLTDQTGQPELETNCSTGSAELDDTGSPSALRAGFFIQSSALSSAVLIDDLELTVDPGGSGGAAGSGGIGGESSEAGASGAPESGADAGPGPGEESAGLYVRGGGCACRSATPGRSAGALFWVVLAGVAVRARRRR